MSETNAPDVTVDRLEDQLKWYDKSAGRAQKAFRWLKIGTIVASALIPVSSPCPHAAIIASSLAFIVIVLEALQQLGQYQHNWITYRSTAEALKHEKYLYFAKAGAYADAADPHRLLAEQVESLVSQEHARWVKTQEPKKDK